MKWYRKAADQGDSSAQFDLYLTYHTGDGVPRDDREAVKWLRKLDEHPDAWAASLAAYWLGEAYRLAEGVSKDLVEAVKWYRKAADQGDSSAQFRLGLAYRNGDGVPKDHAEAARWMRKAAEQGDRFAQFLLGTAYSDGDGVPEDDMEAAKWYRKAAEQGDASAQFNLGASYHNGQGVPKDDVESYKWYNLAAAQGEAKAAAFRDLLARQMTPSQVAEGQRMAREFRPRKAAAAHRGDNTAEVEATPATGGTGFFVTDDGYLLTSYHVVEEATRIVVKAGGKQYPAKLVKADKANDVALLKVSGSFRALPIGASRGVKLGESVFTVGFPNTEIQGVEPKLTRGDINSLNGAQDDPRAFQISAAVQPGNSGGPLVNQCGNVVGIVESRLSDIATLKATGSLPQNVNYALKSSLLNVLLESLPKVSAKLKEPYPAKERRFEDVVKEAQDASALVLVY